MKRVLVITYYWPPSGGSGVQRWVKFTKYLGRSGWQGVIYTPSNPDCRMRDESLAAEIPSSAEILKRPIREVYGLWRKFLGKKGEAAGANPIVGGNHTWKDRLSLAVRGNLFIPDPRVWWLRPSVRFLTKYLRARPVDLIVSTGPPHSMHLIARKLARKTGLPWLADFRDPWTKMFYFKHLPLTRWAERKYRRLERQVLDEASAVVAASPLVQEDFRKMTRTPVYLITNGYDEEDFRETAAQDGHFNLTHCGLLFSGRNPECLWKALAEKVRAESAFASKLRIRLAGKTDEEVLESLRAFGLASCTVNLGYVSHAEAVRELQKATVLFLPLRKEPETTAILPGKLFEYLAVRKPVLGIADPEGAMAAILRDARAGVVCDWEEEDKMAAFIDRCWEDFKVSRDGMPAGGGSAAEDVAGSAAGCVAGGAAGSAVGCAAGPFDGGSVGKEVPDGAGGSAGESVAGGAAEDVGDIARFSRIRLTETLARLMDSLIAEKP